jgi:hypothetical protein
MFGVTSLFNLALCPGRTRVHGVRRESGNGMSLPPQSNAQSDEGERDSRDRGGLQWISQCVLLAY